MGPQDTYVVKMEHLVTRARVRGELAPSRPADPDRGGRAVPPTLDSNSDPPEKKRRQIS